MTDRAKRGGRADGERTHLFLMRDATRFAIIDLKPAEALRNEWRWPTRGGAGKDGGGRCLQLLVPRGRTGRVGQRCGSAPVCASNVMSSRWLSCHGLLRTIAMLPSTVQHAVLKPWQRLHEADVTWPA